MRLVLQAGKSIPMHHMPNELTLQCMEGIVELHAHEKVQQLHAGDLVFLEKDIPYALHAVEDASLLMTVALHHASENADDTGKLPQSGSAQVF